MATKELIQEYQSTKGKPYKRVVKPFKIVTKTPKPKSQNLKKPSKAQIEGRFTGASGLKLLSYGGTNTKTAKNADSTVQTALRDSTSGVHGSQYRLRLNHTF